MMRDIIIISPFFFQFHDDISEHLRKMGNKVRVFDERHSSTKISKIILKISPVIYKNKIDKYYKNILENIGDQCTDIIFIKGQVVPEWFLEDLVDKHPHINKILYLYDAIDNNRYILKKLKYFNRVLSFDRSDCARYDLEFLPLYYKSSNNINRDENITKGINNCVGFFGTIHSDRITKLLEISEQLEEKSICYDFYLYNPIKMYCFFMNYRLRLRKSKLRLTSKPLTGDALRRFIKEHDVFIDIHHPNQTGLTARTFEILSMGKRLITSNADIVNYKFYCPQNIYIIDRNDIQISEIWLEEKLSNYTIMNLKSYNIDNFVKKMLGV